MSEVLGVQLKGLQQLYARLDSMSPTLQSKLRIFISTFVIRLGDQVRTNIVSRFNSEGPLYKAVQSEIERDQPGEITGRVFIEDIPYAAIQEYGGRTSPHVIEAVNGKALAFMMGGGGGFSGGGGDGTLIMVKKVNHPGSNIPERSYARLALVQLRGDFEDGIRAVVAEAVSPLAIAAE